MRLIADVLNDAEALPHRWSLPTQRRAFSSQSFSASIFFCLGKILVISSRPYKHLLNVDFISPPLIILRLSD